MHWISYNFGWQEGSLRKRALASSDEEPPQSAGSQDPEPRPPNPKGGIRQRRRTTADEVDADEPADDVPADLPLNRIKKKRCGQAN